MEIALTIGLWLLVGTANAYYANQRGRDPFAWFIIGMLLGFIGLIILALLPAIENKEDVHEMDELLPESPQDYVRDHYESKEWFYLDKNRNQVGPVSFLTLKRVWGQTDLQEDSLVWSEGMQNWSSIKDLIHLKEGLS